MAGDSLLELLGGPKAIGKKGDREIDFDSEIRRGFRSRVFISFKTKTKLPNAVLSRVLGVSGRSIDRLVVKPRIGPVVSDRLYRSAKIFALAEEVLEDRDQALRWMSSTQRGLGDRRPLDLIATEAGTREVEEELMRIEHGFVA